MPIICTDAPFHYLKPMYLSLCMPIIYHCTAGTLPVALTPPYLQIYYLYNTARPGTMPVALTPPYLTNLLVCIYHSRPVTLPVALTPPLPVYPLHGRYLARGSNATVFNQLLVCMYHCTARYLARGSNATVNSIPFYSVISGISHCLCYDTIIGY
jgi:hypothetical protein